MITSHHNQLLKDIRRLHRRRDGGRFVAEGEDLVAAADAAGWKPVVRLRAGVDVEEGALAKVSSLGSGTRELAVYEERWAHPAGPVCVALWGVRRGPPHPDRERVAERRDGRGSRALRVE